MLYVLLCCVAVCCGCVWLLWCWWCCCGLCVCVCVVVCVVVCGCVWLFVVSVCGAAWHAEPLPLLTVCTFKTPPCVPATRPHVDHMRTCCRYTRRRFESTHGDFSACQAAPHTHTHTHTNTQTHTHCTTSKSTRIRTRKVVNYAGTCSWWLVAILMCKSFVTFRSSCFPQDSWS